MIRAETALEGILVLNNMASGLNLRGVMQILQVHYDAIAFLLHIPNIDKTKQHPLTSRGHDWLTEESF